MTPPAAGEPLLVDRLRAEFDQGHFIPWDDVLAYIDAARSDSREPDWTALANDIRVVDGNHDLGAGELAARLIERGWTRAARSRDVPQGLTPKNAPVIDDHFPDASFEMRRGWEAAIRALAAEPEGDGLDAARQLIAEMAPDYHYYSPVRLAHTDPSDKTGWNVKGIETCGDPLCVEALRLVPSLRASGSGEDER